MARTYLLPDGFDNRYGTHIYFVIISIYLEITNIDLYRKFRSGDTCSEEVSRWFGLTKPYPDSRGVEGNLWRFIDSYGNPEPDPKSIEMLREFQYDFRFGNIRETLERLLADCLDTFTVRDQ